MGSRISLLYYWLRSVWCWLLAGAICKINRTWDIFVQVECLGNDAAKKKARTKKHGVVQKKARLFSNARLSEFLEIARLAPFRIITPRYCCAALPMCPCGTNSSSSASANINMKVTIDNFDGENGGNSELMSSSSVPDDFTLGNHGSQDALDMPPCGTNSSNFDGENGGNSELMSYILYNS